MVISGDCDSSKPKVSSWLKFAKTIKSCLIFHIMHEMNRDSFEKKLYTIFKMAMDLNIFTCILIKLISFVYFYSISFAKTRLTRLIKFT